MFIHYLKKRIFKNYNIQIKPIKFTFKKKEILYRFLSIIINLKSIKLNHHIIVPNYGNQL